MTFQDSEDRNNLAMLAVPVILSMLLGFSGNVSASGRLIDETTISERIDPEGRSMGSSEKNETRSQSEVVDEETRKKELQAAVVSGDYERFLALTSDTPFAEIMTEAAFRELAVRYQHEQAGFKISPFTG